MEASAWPAPLPGSVPGCPRLAFALLADRRETAVEPLRGDPFGTALTSAKPQPHALAEAYR